MSTKHELKTWPRFFEPLSKGEKTFELRKNDRNFQVGDTLECREWSPDSGYSGRVAHYRITYICRAEDLQAVGLKGLNNEYCILGLY